MLTLKTTLDRLFNRPASSSHTRRECERRRLGMEWLEDRMLLCNPGELDLTFGTGGMVVTSIHSGPPGYTASAERAHAIALQSDGKSVVAGYTHNGNDFDIAVARYNVNGSLDTSFSGDGIQTVTFGKKTDDQANAIAIQPDGKIVVAGYTRSTQNLGTSSDFALVRLNTNGSLDTSFGSGGKVSTNFVSSSYDVAYSVAIQSNGKIVAGGIALASGDFALVRYNANGSLDTSFGGGGKVTTNVVGDTDRINSVVILSDGRILVGGQSRITGQDNDFTLARYTTSGSLDATFGTGGIVRTDFAGGSDSVRGVAIQSDGRIVAAGETLGPTTGRDFAAARYNTDGSLDLGFNTSGTLTIAFSAGSDSARGVALQSDGKIVLAGGGSTAFDLASLNTDGSLDSTFGTGGMVTTDFGRDPEGAFGVAIQSDGHIITAGAIGGSGTEEDFALARYCP